MKKVLFPITAVLLLINSCKKDEPVSPHQNTGTLSINIGLNINSEGSGNRLKSTAGVEDLKVMIFTSDENEYLVYEQASEMPDEIILESGEYYVAAHSDNLVPAGFDNPYYFGKSDLFSVEAGTGQTVDVICELANCAVTVEYAEQTLNDFSECNTEVSTSGGSLLFDRAETRTGYFELEPISISCTLTYSPDGIVRILNGSIRSPQPKMHYEIMISTTLDIGNATVNLDIDQTVNIENVELTEIIVPVPQPDDIPRGNLLITEIMYDPDAIVDTEGEWFEIYNNSDHAINLQNLVIIRDHNYYHTINGSVELNAGAFCICARSSDAVAETAYIYGSAITLTNTAATLILNNYGTNGMNGTQICSVAYDEEAGFPEAKGRSIQLDPDCFSADEAELASSWCPSTAEYSTGDLGTPGTENTECN